MRFIKKSKGVISIFLILILVPVMTMSVVLVDGSRARSAKTMAQEVSDLAAMSVLSNYNSKLKDEFGLFAIDEGCNVEELYNNYLKNSLNATSGATEEMSVKNGYDFVQNTIWGSNKYKDLKFWNLYNFNINNTTLNKDCALADPYVLQNQIIEYTKYRGVGLIAERLEILQKTKKSNEIMKTQQKVLKLMQEKEKIDAKCKSEEIMLFNIQKEVNDYNESLDSLKSYKTRDELHDNINKSINCYRAITELEECITEIKKMEGMYQSFCDKYNEDNLESDEEKEVIEEVKDIINKHKECERNIANLKDIIDKDLEELEKIPQNIDEIIKNYEENNDSEETNSNDIPTEVREYIDKELEKFKKLGFKTYIEEEKEKYNDQSVSKDSLKKMGEDVSNKTEANTETQQKVNLNGEEYKSLPSKSNDPDDQYTKIKYDFDGESDSHISVGDICDSLTSGIENTGEAMRNDALVYSYILGDFKTRLTDKGITSEDMPSQGFNDDYHVQWRYKNEDGEHDLRGNPKSQRKTRFNTSEVEYMFAGTSSETANEVIVYSWIYAERMANNTIAVYMNADAKKECMAAAVVASLATEGVVPVQVFYHMFMIAWAAGETAIDLEYLTNYGYKIPLIKTQNDLYIEHLTDVASAINSPEKLIENKKSVKGNFEIKVTYEDYLVMMLMTVDRETRLKRVADLVQLNMIENGKADFKMRDAYTYIEANSEVSIKYLFKDVSQFAWGYNNVSGITFKNSVCQGY